MNKLLEKLTSEFNSIDFQDYVFRKLGLDKALTRRFMQALVEFIAIGLRSGKTVKLSGIGKFSATKTRRVRITIRGSRSLLTAIDERTEVRLSTYAQELAVKQNKAKQSRAIHEELAGKSSKALFRNPDLIKISFLKYLQQHFIWGRPWQHPYTKETYNFDLIKSKLLALRELNPKAYKALFILWVRLDKRKSRLNHFGIRERSLENLWNKATDTMMLLLMHPDLPPDIVKTLTTTNLDGRQPRSTDDSEGTECYGLHRTTGIVSNRPRTPRRELPAKRPSRNTSPYWSGEEFVRDG